MSKQSAGPVELTEKEQRREENIRAHFPMGLSVLGDPPEQSEYIPKVGDTVYFYDVYCPAEEQNKGIVKGTVKKIYRGDFVEVQSESKAETTTMPSSLLRKTPQEALEDLRFSLLGEMARAEESILSALERIHQCYVKMGEQYLEATRLEAGEVEEV